MAHLSPLKRCFQSIVMLALILSPFTDSAQAQILDTCRIFNFQGPNSHGIYLFSPPGGQSTRFLFDSTGGNVTVFMDSTVNITGVVTSATQPNNQWDVNIWLINVRDFQAWTALGRGYKIEDAPPAVVNANVQDWLFFEMDDTRSTLIGVPGTTYAGDTMFLSHRPSSLQFGFQGGNGANAKTGEDDGISGWFSYSGAFSGKGDINATISCPEPDTCAVQIDSVRLTCDSAGTSFTVDLSVSGGGGYYNIWDGDSLRQGGPGFYTFGPYPDSVYVSIQACDTLNLDCCAFVDSITANCAPQCDLSIDTAYTQCLTDTTFETVLIISGTPGDPVAGFTVYNNQGDTLRNIFADTLALGNHANGTYVDIMVQDTYFPGLPGCLDGVDSLTFVPDSATQMCNRVMANFLPPGLSNIEAHIEQGQEAVTLSWQSNGDERGTYFIIERNMGQESFMRIGKRELLDMDVFERKFFFTDDQVESNTWYQYRIRQIRPGGIKTYSKTIRVMVPGEKEVMLGEIFPNPSIGLTQIKINATDPHRISCDIVDMNGKTVMQSVVSTNGGTELLDLPGEGLPAGVYFVRFMLENNQTYIRKLIVID